MSDASTIAYSITSNESSIQPSEAATNARRARWSASRHQREQAALSWLMAGG